MTSKQGDACQKKLPIIFQPYAQFFIDDFFLFLKQFHNFWLDDYFYYRGQADAEWGLKSSYDRYKEAFGPSLVIPEYCDSTCDRILFQGELDAINYYQAINDTSHDTRHPKLEALSEMQHYGAATRLLDVTESFGVALFFAIVENKKEYAAIWAINKNVLISYFMLTELINSPLTKGEKYYLFNPRDKMKMYFMEKHLLASYSRIETGINEKFCEYAEYIIGNPEVIDPPNHPYSTVYPGVFAIRPMIFNHRLFAQNGVFLFQQSLEFSFMDNLARTLNKASASEIEKNVLPVLDTPRISETKYDSTLLNTALVKFIIPKTEFKKCESILKAMNINYKSLFPDKHGRIKTAEKKYFPN